MASVEEKLSQVIERVFRCVLLSFPFLPTACVCDDDDDDDEEEA